MWSLNITKTKKAARPKRGAKQALSLKRRRRISIFLRTASLISFGAVIIASSYIWKSGLYQVWMTEAQYVIDKKVSAAGFAVNEVNIKGYKNTELKQVRAALLLDEGQSIVSLDLEYMLANVEALPWVKRATIIKIIPDTLEITITEHEAVALWQENNQLYLVDEAGEIISIDGLERYASLPQVVGVGANKNLTGLLAMQDKHPELFSRIKSFSWIGKRRWDLNLTNGIKIKLPEKGPELAWDRLYEYESNQNILSKEVLIIDFRQHGKTIVRLTPEEAERRRLLNKSGKKKESI